MKLTLETLDVATLRRAISQARSYTHGYLDIWKGCPEYKAMKRDAECFVRHCDKVLNKLYAAQQK